MMNVDQLRSMMLSVDKRELANRVATDLDRMSPLIGAEGPPDRPGPEEPYIRVLGEPADAELSRRLADALHVVLLEAAAELERSLTVTRPLLLYNVFALLEAVKLSRLEPVMEILRRFDQPLADALTNHHDDLYAQLLLAHAVNQDGSAKDIEFWLGLLQHANVDYVNAGVVGLRESGPRNALWHLPPVKEAHERCRQLGSFSDEVMLLLDTYPDFNWGLTCGEFVLDPDTLALIRQHDRERYRPKVEELPGPAADRIRQAGKADEVQQRRETWHASSPTLALTGATNGVGI